MYATFPDQPSLCGYCKRSVLGNFGLGTRLVIMNMHAIAYVNNSISYVCTREAVVEPHVQFPLTLQNPYPEYTFD